MSGGLLFYRMHHSSPEQPASNQAMRFLIKEKVCSSRWPSAADIFAGWGLEVARLGELGRSGV
jgi:hypothetical protein